jgi:RNA polymerase sigma-70 factor (ECF subfamily)
MFGHVLVMSEGTGSARLARSGEDALFGELYRRHYRPVRDFCRRRVASDLVDDAVAETFLVAWRRLDDVPPGDGALVWLYGVAYRVIGHLWRSAARRGRLEDRLRSVVRRPASAADESVLYGAEYRLVLEAVACLAPTDAEVLRLAAWEQLCVVDIAAVLGITPNAVNQRLHRARRNLARQYRRLESRLSTPDAPKGGAR